MHISTHDLPEFDGPHNTLRPASKETAESGFDSWPYTPTELIQNPLLIARLLGYFASQHRT